MWKLGGCFFLVRSVHKIDLPCCRNVFFVVYIVAEGLIVVRRPLVTPQIHGSLDEPRL